ncbi:MAG: TlyA family RNA methyltransferase [Lentisphaerae bacterium]|nr:TlyA family RNA methyltransferase [Lentisphaerota bacterium]
MGNVRLDMLLVERGLAESGELAERLIRAGRVEVHGQIVDKPAQPVPSDIDCLVRAPPPYVSRGGEKLDGAFAAWPLDVRGRVCLDVGASTGGFTDCLLQRGAERVYAVDVGKGQLHWKLRQDDRVVVRENVNARYLQAAEFQPRPTFAVVDVSFISLTKVLPAVQDVLAPDSLLVTLIKPQFEAERRDVGKGGVVRDAAVRERVVEAVRAFGTETLRLTWVGVVESPLKGPAGNVEFLACWKKQSASKESA